MPTVNWSFSKVLALAGLVLTGCSGGSLKVTPPSIDAYDSASRAMEAYDSSGDGVLDEAELASVPGLQASMETVDKDKDGKVSEEEIAGRILSWQESNIGVAVVDCVVLLDGVPLEGAEITFQPESFLGDDIRAAIAYSDSFGNFSPTIPKANRPSPNMPYGIQLGFYRVKISKQEGGNETLPAKYNAETTLGQQIATDDPAIIRQKIVFRLENN